MIITKDGNSAILSKKEKGLLAYINIKSIQIQDAKHESTALTETKIALEKDRWLLDKLIRHY